MNKSSTRTIVATGLGAALFMVLFMFVKVPSPVPETNLEIAYGVSTFFAVASGTSALIAGLASKKVAPRIEEGEFGGKQLITFAIYTVIGQAVSWILIAPVLDIVLYSEPVNLVFTQGIIAFAMDTICAVVVGGLLLKAYAATRTGKGTLSKNN